MLEITVDNNSSENPAQLNKDTAVPGTPQRGTQHRLKYKLRSCCGYFCFPFVFHFRPFQPATPPENLGRYMPKVKLGYATKKRGGGDKQNKKRTREDTTSTSLQDAWVGCMSHRGDGESFSAGGSVPPVFDQPDREHHQALRDATLAPDQDVQHGPTPRFFCLYHQTRLRQNRQQMNALRREQATNERRGRRGRMGTGDQ